MAEIGTEEWARDAQRPHVTHFTNKPHDPKRCCASVPDGGRHVTFHQCSRKPKVFYGALGYCTSHDPVAVAEKRRAQKAAWKAEWEAKAAAIADAKKRREFEAACIAAIREIAAGHNDPRSLASGVLALEPTQPPA